MEDFVNVSKKGLVAVLILGIMFYALAMFAFALRFQPAVDLLTSASGPYTFGLPICAVAAFGVVALLDTLTPAGQADGSKLEFKAFGLTFSGPAGPVTLWIAVYLTLVGSMQLVR